MKMYIKNSEPIMAMATINPKLCQNSNIRIELVQSNEGPIPHVHVYSGKGKSGKCSYVSLIAPKYANHHSDSPLLTKKEKAEFVEIMTSIWSKYGLELNMLDDEGNPTGDTYLVKATGYEAAVQIWCDTYNDAEKHFTFDKSGRPKMPDYTLLATS